MAIDPIVAALLAAGGGFGQAAGPSRTPVGFGAALGQAAQQGLGGYMQAQQLGRQERMDDLRMLQAATEMRRAGIEEQQRARRAEAIARYAAGRAPEERALIEAAPDVALTQIAKSQLGTTSPGDRYRVLGSDLVDISDPAGPRVVLAGTRAAKAPTTRTVQIGAENVTQEFDPGRREWVEVGRAPAYAPREPRAPTIRTIPVGEEKVSYQFDPASNSWQEIARAPARGPEQAMTVQVGPEGGVTLTQGPTQGQAFDLAQQQTQLVQARGRLNDLIQRIEASPEEAGVVGQVRESGRTLFEILEDAARQVPGAERFLPEAPQALEAEDPQNRFRTFQAVLNSLAPALARARLPGQGRIPMQAINQAYQDLQLSGTSTQAVLDSLREIDRELDIGMQGVGMTLQGQIDLPPGQPVAPAPMPGQPVTVAPPPAPAPSQPWPARVLGTAEAGERPRTRLRFDSRGNLIE